jgi:hypothetical protein
MNVEDGRPVDKEFQFDCAHCGKELSGNYLPRLCPSCGRDHTHRIGLEPLVFINTGTWRRCSTDGCTKIVNVKDFPKLTTAQGRNCWVERALMTGKGDEDVQGNGDES